MMKLPSIQQALLETKRAAQRFPLVLVCTFVATTAALILIETDAQQKPSPAYPILFAAALGIPLLAALALAAEKRKWNRGPSTGIQLLGVMLLVAYAFTVPTNLPNEPAMHFIRFMLLAAGLILLLMIAPYIKKGEVNGFWQYNRTLCFRLFVTAVFAAVLFAGLAIALAALDNLFGITVPEKRYGELWVLVAGLFSPWFFLAGIPENLDELEHVEDYPKGLKVFAQYILFTLVIVYLVILYAYLLKILFQWNWPKGWVSGLILGFSATAILSLLLMHPIRDRSGNLWIRAAGKWLYIVLIPLVVVLFLAVAERIGDYGITESRYAGIALGIWLSAQALYFLFSRAKSIKFTLVSLCVPLFLISFGPWGILGVSEQSQVGRLKKLLAKDSILVDGKVRKEHGKVTQEDAQEISSIVSYLSQIHGYSAIQPWFAGKLEQDGTPGSVRYLSAADVLGKMDVQYYGHRAPTGGRAFILDLRKPAYISGYDRLIRQQSLVNDSDKKEHRFDGDGISCVASGDLDKLTLLIGDAPGFETVPIDIGGFAEKLSLEFWDADSGISGKMSPESMAIATEQNGLKVKVLFQRLFLTRKDGKTAISSYSADIAYTIRK
jgi:hypothetical protein